MSQMMISRFIDMQKKRSLQKNSAVLKGGALYLNSCTLPMKLCALSDIPLLDNVGQCNRF